MLASVFHFSTFLYSLISFIAFWVEIYAFSVVTLHRSIFHAHWAVCLNANGQRADQLSRLQMPKPVTHPSLQVFQPIYLSLLPMTRHKEMDTETLLNIDSGSCNSQARRGLSPASSFHFLYIWERETARDWARDNVSRQKSIFCFHLLTLSKSIIFGQSKCLLWQQGAWVSKEKGQESQRLVRKGLYVDLRKCYTSLSVRKFEKCWDRMIENTPSS